MKNILIPYDFSARALNALRFALDLSKGQKSELHLLHVVKMPVLQQSAMLPISTFEEDILHDARKQAELEFETIEKKFFRDAHIKTKVRFGDTTDTILEYLDTNAIHLVVMGTKGATGLREVFIGSNAERIVRGSNVPVLVVKEFIPSSTIKNIVFPNMLDDDSDEDLIEQVKALQAVFKATLHVVWINTPSNFKSQDEVQRRLETFANRNGLINYTVNMFNDYHEERGIVNFTHSIGADLIALGTHGRTGLSHIIHGSIAEGLVNHANKPVWTYTIKAS